MPVATKHPYLVVYDYGSGGVWGLVNARSKDEIRAKYPKLSVVDKRPAWMSDDEYGHIASTLQTDIDAELSDWWRRMTASDDG